MTVVYPLISFKGRTNVGHKNNGSVVILGRLTMLNPPHAYALANLKRKNFMSTTPLNEALKASFFALKASAAALLLNYFELVHISIKKAALSFI